MSTDALQANSAGPTLRQQAAVYWRSRAPRERLALVGVAVVLGLLLAWLLLVEPAWRTAREAPAQLDQFDRQLQLI